MSSFETTLKNLEYAWDRVNDDGIKSTEVDAVFASLMQILMRHAPVHSDRGYRCEFDDEVFPCTHFKIIEDELE